MKDAQYFQYDIENSIALCHLCPQNCRINDKSWGRCKVRYNNGRSLMTASYGNFCSFALDPIEKKPLYRFWPGNNILSLGGVGCNLNCRFCQNWQLVHNKQECQYISPEDLLRLAVEQKVNKNIGVAFTYNEPLIAVEYIKDAAPMLRNEQLKTVLVTNGFVCKQPWQDILPFIDAANIDVKAFNDYFYRHYCDGSLAAVKQAVTMACQQCHVEIACLIIPGLNDDEHEMSQLASWLAGIDSGIALHINRYFPRYKMTLPPTPVATLQRLAVIAKQFLQHVYIGNC